MQHHRQFLYRMLKAVALVHALPLFLERQARALSCHLSCLSINLRWFTALATFQCLCLLWCPLMRWTAQIFRWELQAVEGWKGTTVSKWNYFCSNVYIFGTTIFPAMHTLQYQCYNRSRTRNTAVPLELSMQPFQVSFPREIFNYFSTFMTQKMPAWSIDDKRIT